MSEKFTNIYSKKKKIKKRKEPSSAAESTVRQTVFVIIRILGQGAKIESSKRNMMKKFIFEKMETRFIRMLHSVRTMINSATFTIMQYCE